MTMRVILLYETSVVTGIILKCLNLKCHLVSDSLRTSSVVIVIDQILSLI